MGSSFSLIHLGSIGPGEKTDVKQSKIFKEAWNKKFPDYPCFLKKNPHDFGDYVSVEIPERYLELADEKDISLESEAINLAEELELDF